MSERDQEGYRQVWVSESVFRRLEETRQGKPTPGVSAQQQASGACGLTILVGPDGKLIAVDCGGKCGFIDRLFGRTCKYGTSHDPDGTHYGWCYCGGGWIDRLFGWA